ncbi:MAG: family transposase, partial [Arthrobacter sp.]|nr:family transposase [Arthrobacter sp.]
GHRRHPIHSHGPGSSAFSRRGRKNDRIDAAAAACVAALGGARPLEAEGHADALAVLDQRRVNLAQSRVRAVNRLHALLRALLPGGAPTDLSANTAAAPSHPARTSRSKSTAGTSPPPAPALGVSARGRRGRTGSAETHRSSPGRRWRPLPRRLPFRRNRRRQPPHRWSARLSSPAFHRAESAR